jgi:hypothetical protein
MPAPEESPAITITPRIATGFAIVRIKNISFTQR